MTMMKKIFTLLLILMLNPVWGFAEDMVDDSIDSEIKTRYNTKKIEDDLLPDLPKDLPALDDNVFSPSASPSPSLPSNIPKTTTPSPSIPAKTTTNSYVKNNLKTSTVLNSGKKFKVKLQNSISDKTLPGTRLTFVSQSPETFRYLTIPQGTIFKGRVKDSHPPYLSGNGGLIVIQVEEMIYQGVPYEIDAKISIADGKKIFFNNIKGKRKFMKNMWHSTAFGSKFLKKMWKTTCSSLNKGGLNILVAPFSLAAGTVVYAGNVAASPVLALFSKGGSVTIPANSRFVIQLRKDALILR